MEFVEKYTTQVKYDADPITEKNKTILSPEAYAVGELLEELKKEIKVLGFRIQQVNR